MAEATTPLPFKDPSKLSSMSINEVIENIVNCWLPQSDSNVISFLSSFSKDFAEFCRKPSTAENLLLRYAPDMIAHHCMCRYIVALGHSIEASDGNHVWAKIWDAAELACYEFLSTYFANNFEFKGNWIWSNLFDLTKLVGQLKQTSKQRFLFKLSDLNDQMIKCKNRAAVLVPDLYFHMHCYLALALVLRAELQHRYPDEQLNRLF